MATTNPSQPKYTMQKRTKIPPPMQRDKRDHQHHIHGPADIRLIIPDVASLLTLSPNNKPLKLPPGPGNYLPNACIFRTSYQQEHPGEIQQPNRNAR
jgi:hypothetical protein